MAEEKKLGPNVTYVDKDKSAKTVTISGVLLEDGKSVNLVEALGGEDRAKPVLAKLAGNPYFKVDGGPDHAADQKKRDEAAAKQAEREEKIRAEAEKDEIAKSSGQPVQTPEQKKAEEDYEGPEQATLEGDNKRVGNPAQPAPKPAPRK